LDGGGGHHSVRPGPGFLVRFRAPAPPFPRPRRADLPAFEPFVQEFVDSIAVEFEVNDPIGSPTQLFLIARDRPDPP